MFFDKRPTKYVLIAGCRSFEDYSVAKKYIDMCLKNIRKEYKIIIISGGAKGADKLGERYAHENRMKCIYYYPDWERYGKSAGPRRNSEMVKKADYVICFWDGKSRGTRSTIDFTKQMKKPLRIKYII